MAYVASWYAHAGTRMGGASTEQRPYNVQNFNEMLDRAGTIGYWKPPFCNWPRGGYTRKEAAYRNRTGELMVGPGSFEWQRGAENAQRERDRQEGRPLSARTSSTIHLCTNVIQTCDTHAPSRHRRKGRHTATLDAAALRAINDDAAVCSPLQHASGGAQPSGQQRSEPSRSEAAFGVGGGGGDLGFRPVAQAAHARSVDEQLAKHYQFGKAPAATGEKLQPIFLSGERTLGGGDGGGCGARSMNLLEGAGCEGSTRLVLHNLKVGSVPQNTTLGGSQPRERVRRLDASAFLRSRNGVVGGGRAASGTMQREAPRAAAAPSVQSASVQQQQQQQKQQPAASAASFMSRSETSYISFQDNGGDVISFEED